MVTEKRLIGDFAAEGLKAGLMAEPIPEIIKAVKSVAKIVNAQANEKRLIDIGKRMDEYVPFLCSACGKTTSWYHAQTANYCPNCGAKMEGGAENGRTD